MAKNQPIVTPEVVKHVAEVARLDLTDKELKKFQKDLADIVEAFQVLDKVNVEGVEPSFQPQPVEDVVRDDKLEPCLDHEKALSLSKHTQKGFFKGPKAV